MALINPNIIEESGKELGLEGCLSIPNFRGRFIDLLSLKFLIEMRILRKKYLKQKA